MPVTKYRSVDDIPAPPAATGPSLVPRIRAMWRRARLLAPPRVRPRGVFRFRSIDAPERVR